MSAEMSPPTTNSSAAAAATKLVLIVTAANWMLDGKAATIVAAMRMPRCLLHIALCAVNRTTWVSSYTELCLLLAADAFMLKALYVIITPCCAVYLLQTGITLPRPVRASPVAAAAKAAAKAAAVDDVAGLSEDGLVANGIVTTPDPVPPTSELLSQYKLKYGKLIEQFGGGSVSIAAADDKITYPDVELPLGPNATIVKIKPSQSWGVADYLTNVTSLRQKYGLTGKGVRIGIIDSGVDYTHAAFGGCTAVNTPAGKCRVVAGYDFVGDDFQLPTDALKPKSDPVRCYYYT